MTNRLLRPLIVVLALVWLPMTVLAQHCATAGAFTSIGGHSHPALAQPGDALYEPLPPQLAVVDAAAFWQAVEEYGACSPDAALCALASPAPLSTATDRLQLAAVPECPTCGTCRFHSLILTPDTPPPRD